MKQWIPVWVTDTAHNFDFDNYRVSRSTPTEIPVVINGYGVFLVSECGAEEAGYRSRRRVRLLPPTDARQRSRPQTCKAAQYRFCVGLSSGVIW